MVQQVAELAKEVAESGETEETTVRRQQLNNKREKLKVMRSNMKEAGVGER